VDASPQGSPALALHAHHDDPLLTWALPDVVVGAVVAAASPELLELVVELDVDAEPDVEPVAAVVVPESAVEPEVLAAATVPSAAIATTPATAAPTVRSRSRLMARSRSVAVNRIADFMSWTSDTHDRPEDLSDRLRACRWHGRR
jgi:hypothetical protein